MRRPDILHQTAGEERTQVCAEKHANNNRAEIGATYSSSNWAGMVRRKFQRVLMVFSCGPDGGTRRTAARRADGDCKLNERRFLPRHMILDIQTRLPPPSLSARNRLEFYMCKKKKRGEKERERPRPKGTVPPRWAGIQTIGDL